MLFSKEGTKTWKNTCEEIDRCPNEEWIGLIREMAPNGAFSLHRHIRNVGLVNLECDVPFDKIITNEII